MNITIAAGLLALFAASNSFAENFLSSAQLEQYTELKGTFLQIAEKAKRPAPPPPAAVCPADAVRGAGKITWDDLRGAFHAESYIVIDDAEFAANFTGAWLRVGEAKDPNQYGAFNPEGLHLDDPWYPASRSGWIGSNESTAGALGGMHLGVRQATFDRQHKVKPGQSSHPARYDSGTASYVINGYTDENTGDWVSARLREIRLIRPTNGGKVTTAVVRDSAISEKGPGRHFYAQYCKVAD